MVLNRKMNMMQQVLQKLWEATDGKLEDVSGIELYENLDAMIKKYESNGFEDAREHIEKGNVNYTNMSTLNEPFIVYDYSVSEFQFLTYTQFLTEGIKKFLDDITAP